MRTRPAQAGVTHVLATITADNAASWALFHGLARRHDTTLDRSIVFERDAHFAGVHPSEFQARIGPFAIDTTPTDTTSPE